MKKSLQLIAIIFFYFIAAPFVVLAQEQKIDDPVPVISNVTSNSFTVTWFSRDSADQAILFGTAEPLTSWAVDDRGPNIDRTTHHATLKNLQPNTEYTFRINTDGKLFKQKTAPELTGLAPLPERFKGKVVTEDSAIPGEGLMYIKIEGAELLSTTFGPTGEYELFTSNIRTQDLSAYFQIKETSFVEFFARAGYEGESYKKIYAYARENPIDFKLQESRVPFYKVRLPGEIFYPFQATPAGQISSSPNPTPGSEENFISVIWKRIREIF